MLSSTMITNNLIECECSKFYKQFVVWLMNVFNQIYSYDVMYMLCECTLGTENSGLLRSEYLLIHRRTRRTYRSAGFKIAITRCIIDQESTALNYFTVARNFWEARWRLFEYKQQYSPQKIVKVMVYFPAVTVNAVPQWKVTSKLFQMR